jgi:hypothetical protein
LPAGCDTVKVSVVVPPTVRPPEKDLSSVGTAAPTVTQAPVVLVPPPAALFEIAAVRLVVPLIDAVPLVLLAAGHVETVGAAALVMGTVIVHEAAGDTTWREATVIVLLPAVAVTLPPEHVPPTVPVPTTRPAGNVSVKLKVCVGLPAGCETVNVSVVLPPTVSAPEKDLSSVGTAAVTATHAPVVLVPPPAALLEMAAATFVVAEMALVPLVFAAVGHVPVVGDAELVTGTVIVHEVPVTWRLATVIVLEPAVAVTEPPAHVPPTAPVPTARPAGSVSVKLKVWVGLPAGCDTVNVRVVEPPTVRPPENALSSVGTAAATLTQAPVVLVPPPAALLEIDAVTFVVAEIALVPLVLPAAGQVDATAGAALVIGTVIVHDVPLSWRLATVMVDEPAVAVTLPLVHVPPVAPLPTTRPAGSVSVKLNVCVGLPVGCETVKVSVVAPPTVKPPENTLSSVGTAAFTVTQAPVVLVPPPAALFAIAAVTFVMPEICALPLVLFAAGHVPTVGAAAVVTGTVIVHEVAGATTWRAATVIVLLPAVAVTLPPVHVPPAPPLASTRPAGSVSVKLKVCVGLPVGCETVNVSVAVPPTVSAPEKALFNVGTAAVTATHAPVVLVPPPAALLETDALMLVVPPIDAVPLVLFAAGHVDTVGAAALVMGTVIVHEAPLTWRLATVIVLLPAVAVTEPPVHVPPVAPLPTTRPAGSVSVKL